MPKRSICAARGYSALVAVPDMFARRAERRGRRRRRPDAGRAHGEISTPPEPRLGGSARPGWGGFDHDAAEDFGRPRARVRGPACLGRPPPTVEELARIEAVLQVQGFRQWGRSNSTTSDGRSTMSWPPTAAGTSSSSIPRRPQFSKAGSIEAGPMSTPCRGARWQGHPRPGSLMRHPCEGISPGRHPLPGPAKRRSP